MTAARAFAEAGDRKSALREIDAALELDPNFLAAHSLRENLLSESPLPVMAVDPPALPSTPTPTPTGAPEGYARFEQRARRRRVDRKIEAARTAIQARRLRDAAAALDEVIELDPNLPELAGLTAEFDDLRRNAQTPHRGRWVAAAAVFATLVFGATWIEHARPTSPPSP